MTIADAIRRVDISRKGNAYSDGDKIEWLSTIDGIIKREIVDTHHGGHHIHFHGYDRDTDVDTELIAVEPYTDLYLYYLEAQIDMHDGETVKYSNDMVRFNNAYQQYTNWYNRKHMSNAPHFMRWW